MISRRFVLRSALVLLPLALVVPALSVRSWQPRRVEFPGAFAVKAPNGGSDVKWTGEGLAVSFFAPELAPGKGRALQIRNWNGQTLKIQPVPLRFDTEQAAPVFSPNALRVAVSHQSSFSAIVIHDKQGNEQLLQYKPFTYSAPLSELFPGALGFSYNGPPSGLGLTALTWSPDGRFIATISFERLSFPSKTKVAATVWWNAQNGRQIAKGHGPRASIAALKFSPDSRILAGASNDGNVYLWNVSNGKLLDTLRGHGNTVCALAWSLDGRLAVGAGSSLISGGWIDSSLRAPKSEQGAWIWNLKRRTVNHITRNSVGGAGSLAFSPDGRTLAVGQEIGGVELLNAFTGEEVRYLPDETRKLVNGLAFSANGDTLAVATSRDLTLWRVK